LLAVGCVLSLPTRSEALTWTISGPGTTGVVKNDEFKSVGSYSLNPAGSSTQTWNLNSIAPNNGDVTIAYKYDGVHSFFSVTAFLDANPGPLLINAGPANCCGSPSNGFSFEGQFTFTGLTAGQPFGFSFGGRNFDSNNVLQGSLSVTQIVPEPASATLGLLSVAGLMLRRRRMA